MSRNKSISIRTSFAAFALLTCCKNVARVNSINSTSSAQAKHDTSMTNSQSLYIKFESRLQFILQMHLTDDTVEIIAINMFDTQLHNTEISQLQFLA